MFVLSKDIIGYCEGGLTVIFEKGKERGILIYGYNDLGEWISFLQVGNKVIHDHQSSATSSLNITLQGMKWLANHLVRRTCDIASGKVRHHLKLPTSLSDARKVQKASCKPSSFWGEFDFTDSDEKRLGEHLSTIYDGKITTK